MMKYKEYKCEREIHGEVPWFFFCSVKFSTRPILEQLVTWQGSHRAHSLESRVCAWSTLGNEANAESIPSERLLTSSNGCLLNATTMNEHILCNSVRIIVSTVQLNTHSPIYLSLGMKCVIFFDLSFSFGQFKLRLEDRIALFQRRNVRRDIIVFPLPYHFRPEGFTVFKVFKFSDAVFPSVAFDVHTFEAEPTLFVTRIGGWLVFFSIFRF